MQLMTLLLCLIFSVFQKSHSKYNRDKEFTLHYVEPNNDLTHLIGKFPTTHWEHPENDPRDYFIFVDNLGYGNLMESVFIVNDTIRRRSRSYGRDASEDSSQVVLERIRKAFGQPTHLSIDTSNNDSLFVDEITTIWHWDLDSAEISIKYLQKKFDDNLVKKVAANMLKYESKNKKWSQAQKDRWKDSVYYAIKGFRVFDEHFLDVSILNPFNYIGLGDVMKACLAQENKCKSNGSFKFEGDSYDTSVQHLRSISTNPPSKWLVTDSNFIEVKSKEKTYKSKEINVIRKFAKIDTFIMEKVEYPSIQSKVDTSCIQAYRKRINELKKELEPLEKIKYNEVLDKHIRHTKCDPTDYQIYTKFIVHQRNSPFIPIDIPRKFID